MTATTDTITQSETIATGAGTITFEVLGHDARHHALSITCESNGVAATVTIDQSLIEELHRAYCRGAHLVRLESRGVWEIREKSPNAFYAWTPLEEEALAAKFQRHVTLAELAQDFGRSEAAIRARLIQLGYHPPTPRKSSRAPRRKQRTGATDEGATAVTDTQHLPNNPAAFEAEFGGC